MSDKPATPSLSEIAAMDFAAWPHNAEKSPAECGAIAYSHIQGVVLAVATMHQSKPVLIKLLADRDVASDLCRCVTEARTFFEEAIPVLRAAELRLGVALIADDVRGASNDQET